ncbi:hypothetical protein FHS51_003417 [Sphingobium wenxiniae]|jgi:hypothetical protein|uniref:Uncharacterized protein n=1 Tax=Sphingobium wenxiniae (strain DSM 21828 / CGMCC 1.7748 / JZ-1) TaxID=595605 RepID=A0A562K877_SPHWJ|nr:hypothetical protein [Sphingobium wenxiniae]MBB6193161.1 hypothetical protein [Sphingobium wenxiniae]MBE5074948.1 hypothetical protein [Erythrobacteraceae bacterium E2-1 Yellow Sea]TWH91607.1 hypothetical protein IQ35_03120 [Sphingobium wenxiniae]
MGSWKSKLRCGDLPEGAKLEAVCRRCGQVRYLTRGYLVDERAAGHLYIDEIEARSRCRVLGCKGRMRLAMMHRNQTSGFVGGMA